MATLRYDSKAPARLLAEHGWSLRQLARRSHVRLETIRGIVQRKHRPRADILAGIARGFGVPIAAFFITGDKEPQPEQQVSQS